MQRVVQHTFVCRICIVVHRHGLESASQRADQRAQLYALLHDWSARLGALPVHCELTAVVDEAPCAARLHALLAVHWVICLPVDEESKYAEHQQLVPGLSSPYFTDFREEGNYLPAIPQQLANPSAGEPPARARIGLSCSCKETTNV